MTLDTLTTLTQNEPWMTQQERDLNQTLVSAIAKQLATAGVPENPLVALRVNDIASTWLLARRLESALTPAEGEPPPCPTPAQAGAIGKCRDRLRRAMKELEACCPRDAAPARQGLGLIEKMHEPVRVVRATGILDDPAASGECNRNHMPHTPYTTQNPQRTQDAEPAPPQNPSPAENHPNPDLESDQPDTRSSTAVPNPPHANPTELPPPPNRATRRLQAREERRNRKGRSKTAPPPAMETYPRTTPQDERHRQTAVRIAPDGAAERSPDKTRSYSHVSIVGTPQNLVCFPGTPQQQALPCRAHTMQRIPATRRNASIPHPVTWIGRAFSWALVLFYLLAAGRAFVPGLCATQAAMDAQCGAPGETGARIGAAIHCCPAPPEGPESGSDAPQPVTPAESGCAFCNLLIAPADGPQGLVLPAPAPPQFAGRIPLAMQWPGESPRSAAPNRAPPA